MVDRPGGPERLGSAMRHTYTLVREFAPTLTDETEWAADVDGLTAFVGDGEFAHRIARVVGGRPGLSDHEPAGI